MPSASAPTPAKPFNRDEVAFEALHQVSPHLYTYLTHFLFNGTIPLNNRSVVVHLPQAHELVIINPAELTAKVSQDLHALQARTGAKVRHLISPGDWHYMFIGSYLQAFAGATAYVPPGRIPSKKPAYPYTLIDTSAEHPFPQFSPDLEVLNFRGMVDFEDPARQTPRFELAFYHAESQAFTAADIFTYVGVGELRPAQQAAGLQFGVLGFHFMQGKIIRDSAAVAESIAKIRAWQPRNYICQHGGLGNMLVGDAGSQLAALQSWAEGLNIVPGTFKA